MWLAGRPDDDGSKFPCESTTVSTTSPPRSISRAARAISWRRSFLCVAIACRRNACRVQYIYSRSQTRWKWWTASKHLFQVISELSTSMSDSAQLRKYRLCKSNYGPRDPCLQRFMMLNDIPYSPISGYGFVMFDRQESAAAALVGLNAAGVYEAAYAKLSNLQAWVLKFLWFSNNLIFRPPQPSYPSKDPTNLYFSNLPESINDAKLQEILQPFGKVVSSRILRDFSTGLAKYFVAQYFIVRVRSLHSDQWLLRGLTLTILGASRGVGFARMESKEI